MQKTRTRRVRRKRRIRNQEPNLDITTAVHASEHVSDETVETYNQELSEPSIDKALDIDKSDAANSTTSAKSLASSGKVLQLYVMADPDRPYAGYELLQTLLSVGLRFGERQIFHRYIQQDQNLGNWFSVAAANKPGVFELGSIGAFSCAGLILFMAEGVTAYNDTALRKMIGTAEQLVEELGGDIWGPDRQSLSVAAIDDLYSQVDSVTAGVDS